MRSAASVSEQDEAALTVKGRVESLELDLTQSRYHRNIDQLYARRAQDRRTDEGEAIPDALATMWDPDLPAAPKGFPAQLDLTLQPAEAAYLRDRIQTTAPQSMLALLAQATHLAPMEGVPYPWRYPGAANFPPAIREVLHHAQILSETMWGAALLYNWQLAGLPAPDGSQDRFQTIREERGSDLERWRLDILEQGGLQRLQAWDFDRLQALCKQPGHTITHRTWAFLAAWRHCVLDCDGEDAPTLPGEDGLEFFTWTRRHIESYVLVPAAIRRVLRLRPDDRRVERLLSDVLPEGRDVSAWQRLDAKQLLGRNGDLARVLGRDLPLAQIARATREDELHEDVHELFGRIRAALGPEPARGGRPVF